MEEDRFFTLRADTLENLIRKMNEHEDYFASPFKLDKDDRGWYCLMDRAPRFVIIDADIDYVVEPQVKITPSI